MVDFKEIKPPSEKPIKKGTKEMIEENMEKAKKEIWNGGDVGEGEGESKTVAEMVDKAYGGLSKAGEMGKEGELVEKIIGGVEEVGKAFKGIGEEGWRATLDEKVLELRKVTFRLGHILLHTNGIGPSRRRSLRSELLEEEEKLKEKLSDEMVRGLKSSGRR